MKGIPTAANSARTTEVLAICIRDRTPSCMRAPPEAEMMINGMRLSIERRASRAIFSPTTDPIEPPMNPKSITPRSMGMPCNRPNPVRIASSGPAFFTASCMRSA